jgi:hypothetical protein
MHVLLVSMVWVGWSLLAVPANAPNPSSSEPMLVQDGAPHALSVFAEPYDSFLKAHVRRRGVDYVAAARDPRRSLIREAMAEVDWDQLSPEGQKAFLIDAYNFLVIDLVCARLPIESVMDVPGFFDALPIQGPQGTVTLDGLEKGLLYRRFTDPRLHFVLVCGAKGCPPLEARAFSLDLGAGLDRRLDASTRQAMADPVLVASSGSVVTLSRIFEWYASDFGSKPTAVLQWINRYRSKPLPNDAELQYSPYDWTLNQVWDR